MARAKATTSDIFARLARGECANFRNASCQGLTPCTIIDGQPCDYFNAYVKPLLDYPEFANRYSREAKITVALNPKAKVIRRRRQNAEPMLAIETPTTPKARAAAPPPTTHTPAATTPRKRQRVEPALTFDAKALPSAAKAGTTKAATKPAASLTVPPPRKETPAAKVTKPAPSKTSRARHEESPITTVVSVSGTVSMKPATKAAAVTAKKPAGVVRPSLPEPQPQLLLELTPDAPKKTTAQRRR